jgi:uncharacterized protein YndB with AHSA1/START domain
MQEPLVFERTYNASAEKIWKALTDAGEMKKWYFDLSGFKAEKGYEFTFNGGPDPSQPYVHLCKITEVVPGKKLSYSWDYKGYKGSSLVTFELFPEGNKTKLRLTHAGLDSFAANNNPDLRKNNFVEGWNHIIGISLKEFLEK